MTRPALVFALVAASLASAQTAAQNQTPIRILLVTGGHDHPPSFYSVFDQVPGFRVTVDPHPRAFDYDMRKRFDVIVLYDMIKAGLDTRKRANLQAFAEDGKGIVVLHHALCSHGDWPWWYEELTGARWIEPGMPGGLTPSTYKEHIDIDLIPVEPQHPILRGIGPFQIFDEAYGKLWFSPKIQVLLKTNHAASDGPVVWIGPAKRSKVVTVQLGHGTEAHHNVNYRNLVHNAIRWSANR